MEIIEYAPSVKKTVGDIYAPSSSKGKNNVINRFIKWWGNVLGTDQPVDVTPKAFYIAWHPTRNVIALSKETSIHVYDVDRRTWLDQFNGEKSRPLQHATMTSGIYCMQWCCDTDSLLVGTSTGIACWRLFQNQNRRFDEDPSFSTCFQFFEHPHKRPVHSLDVSPHGRLVAAMTIGEGVIYIWDSSLSTCSPVYCLNGSVGESLSWSPAGLHIAITDRDGGLVLLDSYTWRYESCCECKQTLSTVCWLGEADCLFYSAGSLNIHTCELLLTQDMTRNKRVVGGGLLNHAALTSGSNLQSISVSTIPVTLDVTQIPSNGCSSSDIVGIAEIVSEERQGSWVAVTFMRWNNIEEASSGVNGRILSFVAVYLVRTKPSLSLTLVNVVRCPEPTSDGYPISFTLRATVARDHDRDSERSIADWVVVDGHQMNGVAISENRTFLAVSWSTGAMSISELR